MTTILFFDDLKLNRLDNMTRAVGRPKLIPESVYRDPTPGLETPWGYPSIFRDEATGNYRMTYQNRMVELEGHTRMPLLAESEDGIHWAPRDTTGEIDLPDRAAPHQVLPLENHGEWVDTFVDPNAETEEKIKALTTTHRAVDGIGTKLWVSPDGIRWRLKEGIQWHPRAVDPGVEVFWNEVRGTYVLLLRPAMTDRRLAIKETHDWKDFSKPELAMQADALDAPLTELYGMPVLPYEGHYVGLLWLYHCVPEVQGNSPMKYRGGHVDCQLAYSLNGWHWQRALRTPFIPCGEPGEPDCGCVYPSSWIIRDNGDIDIVASASTAEHGLVPEGCGSIVMYHLRRDGFVYLESRTGTGFVGTRPLWIRGDNLEVNISCPSGEARVQLTTPEGEPLDGFTFDDCVPFSGDERAWRPRWRGDRNLISTAGEVVRLEISLTGGRLYSFRGDFVPLISSQHVRVVRNGGEPNLVPGF